MKTTELKRTYCLRTLLEYKDNKPKHLEDVSLEAFIQAIELKERAIFKDAKYWVTMNDKFMSGWGMAKGKTNKLIIACETYKQAESIKRNALKRNEMKYVNICGTKPQIKKHVYPSWKHYEDMGEIWTK